MKANEIARANPCLRAGFFERLQAILSLWPGVARLGRSERKLK